MITLKAGMLKMPRNNVRTSSQPRDTGFQIHWSRKGCGQQNGRTRGFWGWRDICRSTDERTLIADFTPLAGCVGEFSLLIPGHAPELCAALLGNLNALVCDYVVRQKVGGSHLKQFTFKQLAIFPPAAYSDIELAFVVPRVLELTYTSHSMTSFALDLEKLTPLLQGDDRVNWLRLIGDDAQPPNARTLQMPLRADLPFANGLNWLRSKNALQEDLVKRTWRRGSGDSGLHLSGWPEGRARFVNKILTKLGFENLRSKLADEDRDWEESKRA